MRKNFELFVQLAIIVFLAVVILSVLWWDGQRKTTIAEKVATTQHIIVYDASAIPKEARSD